MLVLSRKIQEQILIPGLNIRLTILSVGKNRVQLGIEAPKGIQIARPEAIRRSVEGQASVGGIHRATCSSGSDQAAY